MRGRPLQNQDKVIKALKKAHNIPVLVRKFGSKTYRRFGSIKSFANHIGFSDSHVVNIMAGHYKNTTGFDVIKKDKL